MCADCVAVTVHIVCCHHALNAQLLTLWRGHSEEMFGHRDQTSDMALGSRCLSPESARPCDCCASVCRDPYPEAAGWRGKTGGKCSSFLITSESVAAWLSPSCAQRKFMLNGEPDTTLEGSRWRLNGLGLCLDILNFFITNSGQLLGKHINEIFSLCNVGIVIND